MFTGLVQAVGRVEAIVQGAKGMVRLQIDPRGWMHSAALGDSIAVAGCCLTVANAPAGPAAVLEFDLVPETLARTTFRTLVAGSCLNLERSLRVGDLLGGHVVQGHVDGVGTVASVEAADGYRLRITPPPGLMPCLVPKGSVTVDGVSLTLAAVDPRADGGFFEVALIPATLGKTTLAGLKTGDAVNLEADVMAKTIVHYLTHFASSPHFLPPPSATPYPPLSS